MVMSTMPMEGRLLHRRTAPDDWTCNICDTKGPGGVDGFYVHYLREHYEQATDARRHR